MKQLFFILFCLFCVNGFAQNIASTAAVSTSYISPWETLAAVNDGFTPANSGDRDHGIYGNWPNPDSIQWVQYGWNKKYSINQVDIYWFEDGGGILVPTTAYLEYWNSSAWVKIADVPTIKDAFNTVTFPAVITDSIRVSMKNDTQSTGIIEWQVEGIPATTTTDTTTTAGGKKLYIPLEWRDPNNNIPWDSTTRCKQSANFAVFWGPLAGTDPTNNTDPAYKFDPQLVLDSMEHIWNDYIRWHLISDSASIAQYKNIIVINNTWHDGLYTGYAFGGGYDATVGAFWVDKGAFYEGNSFTISHEFTHSCQYIITNILYPGHGFPDLASGFFWETHANFMAWQRNLALVNGMDPFRALNFTSYTQSSARKHYANTYYLELLKDKYGLDFVNSIWHDADASIREHPFQTIARLLGNGQPGVNAFFMDHAMHNVNWDYKETGAYIRQAMQNLGDLRWRPTDILDSIGQNMYAIPDNLAPQQYGYNIVQLYPSDSNCSQPYVHLKFKGHVDEKASSGWLYGFVSVNNDSSVTYSQQYSDSEVTYQFPQGIKEYYLVVLGAPTTFHVHTDLFEIGFPKEFRYPWEVRLQGMVPQGYQPNYLDTAGIAGAPHPNGGGFVAATARVDPSAFVGAHAVVLDNAQVTGNVRIEGKAKVRQNAAISGDVVVKDFGDVYGNSVISDNVVISEQGKVFNTNVSDSSSVSGNSFPAYATINGGSKAFGNFFSFSGTISNGGQFGGDAELFGLCDKGGRYLQPDNLILQPGAAARAYCNGSYDNPLNIDTNAAYTHYGEATMAFGNMVQCGTVTGNAGAPPVVNAGSDQSIVSNVGSVAVSGAATSSGTITATQWIKISGPDSFQFADSTNLSTTISSLAAGVYQFKLLATDNYGNQASDTMTVTVRKSNDAPMVNTSTYITITLPDNDATVTGTATDADGAVKAVAWTQLSGPSNAYIVSPGSLSSTIDRLTEGIYEFVLTATDNEGATGTDTVTITVNKANTNVTAGRVTTPTVFPIPATDMATVNYPATIGGVLSVFDTKGAKILTVQIPPDSNTISFSVKNLATGVYFIRIDTYSKDKYKLKMIVAH